MKNIKLTILIATILIIGASATILATNYAYDGEVSRDVKRDRIMAIAEDYFTLYYYIGSDNIDDWNCPGSTCPDPTIGWITGMKYCWGGEDTTKQYLLRLTEGDVAGNKDTSGGSSYDSCSAGADCSGFVSNAWTSPRRATASFHLISDNIDWDDLRMGDALNNAGSHIRLFDYFTDDTHTAMIYESTGYQWRMQHRSLARNDDYQPIRYNDPGDYKVCDYPEPTITYIKKIDLEMISIRWDGQADQGFRLYQSTDGATWTMIRDYDELTPVLRTCDVSGILPDTTCYFKMTSYNTGDTETDDSDVAAFRYDVFENDARAILVDGADRYRDPSTGHGENHTFMTLVGKALGSRGIGFDYCSNEAVVDQQIDLEDYEAAVWIVADDSTFDESFSWAEQMHITDFLKAGGALFASGAEIGWDLDWKADSSTYKNGSPNDELFYNNYLRADYVDDDADTYHASGVSSTIFDGLDFYFDNGAHGTYDVEYPDMINSTSGATVGMTYQGGSGGNACVYDSSPSSGTVCYMGFPFETIYPESARNSVMGAVMDYFDCTLAAPTMKSVRRTASDTVTITWEGYGSEGFRLSQKIGSGSWSQIQSESTLGSGARSTTVSGLSSLTRYAFKLKAVNTSGAGSDSDVLVCELPVDDYGSTILIVDGYDRWNDQEGVSHTLLENFSDSLANYRFDSCVNEAVADGTISLGDYDIVMWMCGEESTMSETFSYTEQVKVQDYIKSGGKMFVSGAEIGWDLVDEADTENNWSNGNPNDTPFFNNYLKAGYVGDDAGTHHVRGISSTAFDGLSFDFDDGTHGTYDPDYPDYLSTSGGSSEALYYGTTGTNVAGLTYTGTVSGGTSECQVVFFGFPFETIYNASDRESVMGAVLDYLGAIPAPVELSVFEVE